MVHILNQEGGQRANTGRADSEGLRSKGVNKRNAKSNVVPQVYSAALQKTGTPSR